jgi:hypothetical protein
MATAQSTSSPQEVLISHDAMRMLGCFQDGLDEVVQQLAEDRCRERQGPDSHGAIEITPQDVREAADVLFGMLRQLIDSGKASSALTRAIDNMNDCVSCK